MEVVKENINEVQENAQQSKLEFTQSDMFREANKRWEKLARSYNVKDINMAFGNMIIENPDLRNRVLKNVKTMPYLPDRETIENALANPYYNEKILRGIGANLFYNSYPLYKAIRFYDGALLYKYYVSPMNVKAEYMSKPRYIQEKAFVNRYIDKLNPKYTFRRIVQEVMQMGKRAYYLCEDWETEEVNKVKVAQKKFEKEEANFAIDNANRKIKSVFLRDLPDDYIKLTGKSTDSYYTIAFDFSYFMTMGASVDDYPQIFKEYLDKLNSAKKISKKNNNQIISFDTKKLEALQDIEIEKYGYNGKNFYCWVNMPSDVCQVFSADESNPLQASNFLGIFLMSVDLQAYNLLQQQLTGIPLYSMIIGTVPLNEDDKKNPLMLDNDTVTYFTNMINSLLPNGTTYVMSPTKDNKTVTFNEQPNSTKVYGSALQGMISTMGMGGVLSTTDKPSLAQVKTSQTSEVRFVDVLYDQFEHFVNRRLEQLTDSNYLRYDWKFRIFGDIFSYKDRIETLFKGLSQGITSLLPEYLAYFDLTLEDAVSNADMVKAIGIYDKFMPLMSSFQQGQSDGKGRPEKNDGDIESEDTAKSKDSGRNTIDGRVVSNYKFDYEDTLEEMNKTIKEMYEMIQDKGD